METDKKKPRMKPRIFENKQNLSLVQYTIVCLATKVAVIAKTAAKTSALLCEACVRQHLPASPSMFLHAPAICQQLSYTKEQKSIDLLEAGLYSCCKK